MRATFTRYVFVGLALLAFAAVAKPATAFPPYRSTDAETADPWTLELRLGLLRLESERSEQKYASPLLRLNVGLPGNVEIVSELEHSADETELSDAALGVKWVPFVRALSFGTEVLALLPVPDAHEGGGVETALLATLRRRALRLHINAVGFHDARSPETENGWKGGIIGEWRFDDWRPGLELFAKRTEDEPVEVLSGVGVIVGLGSFDVRLGLHAGLTEVAPDLTANLWVTTKLPLR